MKKTNINYHIVVLGNTHNPTVISETFFIKSGIISSEDELDRNKLIITPALCQATIKGKTNVIVEPSSLNINSTEFETPYKIAAKYCENLKFIKSIAIGINFDIQVVEYDFDKLFEKANFSDYNNCTTRALSFVYDAADNVKCNVTLTKKDSETGIFRFNFHQDTKNILLGDLNIDFLSNAEKYLKQTEEFIKSILIYES